MIHCGFERALSTAFEGCHMCANPCLYLMRCISILQITSTGLSAISKLEFLAKLSLTACSCVDDEGLKHLINESKSLEVCVHFDLCKLPFIISMYLLLKEGNYNKFIIRCKVQP